jgi:N utilization substance protein B
MGIRRKARELVLQGMYAWEMNRDRFDSLIESFSTELPGDPETAEFAASLLRKTVRNQEDLDRDIQSVAQNWDLGRMALIDRLTINEAIDLAKKFSTENSGTFVNGILDALFRRYKQEDRIRKTGRGLLD